MSGLKRPRRSLEEDDEFSNGGSDTDSSKRQRTSSPERSNDSEEDDGEDVLPDREVELFSETQAARRAEGNEADDSGVIEQITMINFMCHEHLTLTLGPLINFIIGHNGSGKSAALTALSLSLGGKTAKTSRGTNLKSYIKNGREQATLIVKLKNAGDLSYRHDEFGDSIIIERQFSRAGTSGFKVKSATGKTISTKKSDVDDITDHYGLQMDNPLTVLNQDMARQFLSNSLPQDKYKFFVRGVQLEQLEQDYRLIDEQIAILEATYDDRAAYVVQLNGELQKAKDTYRATSRIQELKEKLEVYRMKMVWCQVVGQERKEEALRKELDQLQTEIRAAHDEFEQAGQSFDEADAAKIELDQQLQAAKEERAPISAQQEAALEIHNSLLAETKENQSEQRLLKDQLKKTQDKIDKQQGLISAEEKRLEEMNGGGSMAKMRELASKKVVLETAQAAVKEHNALESGLLDAITRANNAISDHKKAREPFQAEVEETDARLKALGNSDSRHNIYPRGIDQLKRAIQQDSGFRTKPIGPMGDYVQLRNPVWSSILEKFFGNSLNGFVVTCKDDQERLTALMRREKCSVPVSIINESPIDHRNHEPDREYNTVLRLLEIEHPLVFKYMIINHNIEQVILIEDMDEARTVMFGHRVRNVKACYSLSHNSSTNGERFQYVSSGCATAYAEGWRGKPRMKTPIKERIEHERMILRQQQQRLHEHDNQIPSLRRDVEHAKKEHTRFKQENRDRRVAVDKAMEGVNQIQDSLDQDASNEGRLDQLRETLAKYESEKLDQGELYGACVVAKDVIKDKRAKDLQITKSLEQQVSAANLKVQEIEMQLNRAMVTRTEALVKKNEIDEMIRVKERERDDPEEGLSKTLSNVKRLIADFIVRASEYGPRVPVADDETIESLTKVFEKTRQNIASQEQKLGGSITELQAAYQLAKTRHDTAVQHLNGDRELQRLLSSSLDNRRERWHQFRRHITMRARLGFQYLLSNRAFRGVLKINHKLELLDIEIQPDETQLGKGKRAAKTLSGGEKSFSQICLIVALWEAIGAPIRCLDEFDVFMDSVNRDLAMRILIDAARNSHGRQFILITPQSMSSLADGPDVKVVKMRDPDRTGAQLTLPYAS